MESLKWHRVLCLKGWKPFKNLESKQFWGFPGGSVVKNCLPMQETQVQSLGQENPPEKRMATHSSILAWEIPCTEEPGGLQFIGLQRVGTDLVTKQQRALTWKNSSLCSWFQHFLSVSSLFPVLSLSSNVQLFTTPWTVACHAPLSIGFFRQEYWSGFPFPPPGNLPSPGMEHGSLHCRQILYQLNHHRSPLLFSAIKWEIFLTHTVREQIKLRCKITVFSKSL